MKKPDIFDMLAAAGTPDIRQDSWTIGEMAKSDKAGRSRRFWSDFAAKQVKSGNWVQIGRAHV